MTAYSHPPPSLVSAVLVGLLLLVPSFATSQTPATPNVQRSTIPVGSASSGARPWQLSISRDGQYVVYQTNLGDGWRLYLGRVGEARSTVIPGLGDTPYFGSISRDNKWLLFGKKGAIWKAPLEGGELTLVHTANNWEGWENNDAIVIAAGTGGLARVRADGSLQREQIAAVDTTGGVTSYSIPSMLPDGQGVLVDFRFGTGVARGGVGVVSLSDGKLTRIAERGNNARYAASGHVLYADGSDLKAVPFDARTRRVTGAPLTVIEGVSTYTNGASAYDISENGVLVYVPGPSDLDRVWPRALVWVDRKGSETPFHTVERNFSSIRLSPDRRYVAAQVGGELWLHDTWTGLWSMLVGSGMSGPPQWAQDGQEVYFTRDYAFGRMAIDGSNAWTELVSADHRFWGLSLSPDGSQVLGHQFLLDSPDWQMAGVSSAGGATPEPILGSDPRLHQRNPVVSPDGSWVAYAAKVKGLDGVYVEPFPGGGHPVLVSEGAEAEATEPMWGRSSTELFYRDAANLVSVQLRFTPEPHVTGRSNLFSVRLYYHYLNSAMTVFDYDPATDRFLMMKEVIPDPPGEDIHVISNAFELLNRMAPSRR